MSVVTVAEGVNSATWMGDIPAHWDVARLKYVAKLGTGHTPSRQSPEYWVDTECTIPWVTLADVWQLRDGGPTTTINDTAEKISEIGLANSAAVLHPAGTVILSRTASVGFSAILGVDAATSQDFMTWSCGPRLEAMYLLYVLRTMKQEFGRLVMGSTHKTIYMPDIERLTIPLPPRSEQLAILRLLDPQLSQLDALVGRKKRLLQLLAERRVAVIRKEYSFSIEPRRQPGYRRLGDIADVIGGFPFDSELFNSDGDGMPLIRIRDLTSGSTSTSFAGPYPRESIVDDGDILVGMDGDFQVRRWAGGRAVLNQRICAVRPHPSLDADYLNFVLALPLQAINDLTPQTTVKHLSLDDVRRIQLVLPEATEQRRVVDVLTRDIGRLDSLASTIEAQLKLLEMHRHTLIYDAVTGRLQGD